MNNSGDFGLTAAGSMSRATSAEDSLRRIWLTMPERRSSTRRFIKADTSMYLQLYVSAALLPSEAYTNKYTINNDSKVNYTVIY